ncbi:MAG: hypothetical protein PHC34_07780 [Candidatus Gastranaerophilales bacterium]|nr:hypothetical protein [Candidatus Gastranaerophilales bacterium]
MVVSSFSKIPFYDKKGVFSIYEDKMILHKMGGQVIRFEDIYKILFNRIDFSLFLLKPKKYFTIVHMKNGDAFEIIIPLSGYFALKRYYEKGKKTKGIIEVISSSALSVWALAILVVMLYLFIFR